MNTYLKWAGNKQKISHILLDILPDGNRLIEPFAGTCAVSLADFGGPARYNSYLCNDADRTLIECHKMAAEDPADLICKIEKCFDLMYIYQKKTPEPEYTRDDDLLYREHMYYQFRDMFNETGAPELLVSLNKFGFNGLYRRNRSGGFNVPFGGWRNPSVPIDEILNFEEFGEQATFESVDFLMMASHLQNGDVVYCDPPYIPLSKTAAFTQYSDGFGIERQYELAKWARALASMGNDVVISNSYSDTAFEVFGDADRLDIIAANRSISRNGDGRGSTKEIVASYLKGA